MTYFVVFIALGYTLGWLLGLYSGSSPCPLWYTHCPPNGGFRCF